MMRLYEITYQGDGATGEASTHEYVGTQAEAKRAVRATGGTWRPVEVPTNKAGLLKFLNDAID